MRHRRTNQREAIKSALTEAGRPLSPQEILTAARILAPGIGIATVYRAIKDLTEEEWLAAVEIPGEPARYERGGKPHHHHFHCRGCARVFEVDACPGQFARITPPGFVLEGHEILLRGLCPDCSGNGTADAPAVHAEHEEHTCGGGDHGHHHGSA